MSSPRAVGGGKPSVGKRPVAAKGRRGLGRCLGGRIGSEGVRNTAGGWALGARHKIGLPPPVPMTGKGRVPQNTL